MDLEPSNPTQPHSEYTDLNEATVSATISVTVSTPQSAAQDADYAPLLPSTRSWEVARQHVTIEKIIGKGAFGQVAKGTAEIRSRPGKTTVAIKMLKCKALFYLERKARVVLTDFIVSGVFVFYQEYRVQFIWLIDYSNQHQTWLRQFKELLKRPTL